MLDELINGLLDMEDPTENKAFITGINSIKDKIFEMETNFNSRLEEKENTIKDLKSKNFDLLMKIGERKPETDTRSEEEKITIDDLFDENGMIME